MQDCAKKVSRWYANYLLVVCGTALLSGNLWTFDIFPKYLSTWIIETDSSTYGGPSDVSVFYFELRSDDMYIRNFWNFENRFVETLLANILQCFFQNLATCLFQIFFLINMY
jgi:hypothetical protein